MNRMFITFCIFSAATISVHAQGSETPRIDSSSSVSVSDEMIGKQHGQMSLEKTAADEDYAYTPESAVPVGGGFSKGSKNTYRFLNSLLGPEGQKVHYQRIGTCCEFETTNSPFGDTALLEVYEINFEGSDEAIRLYFNWYDPGEVLIPFGLTAAQ